MMGSMAPSSSGKETWRATCTGWRPSSDASHSWNDWKTSGTAQRYGTPNDFSVSTAFGWSCEAGTTDEREAREVDHGIDGDAALPEEVLLHRALKSRPPE